MTRFFQFCYRHWDRLLLLFQSFAIILILATVISFYESQLGFYVKHLFVPLDWDKLLAPSADVLEQQARKEPFLRMTDFYFHYVDNDLVESRYNDYFRDMPIESIIAEVSTERSIGLKLDPVKNLDLSTSGKKINKIVSTATVPGKSLSEKFRSYLHATLQDNKVYLGLEDADVKSEELSEFHKLVHNIEKTTRAKLEEPFINEFRLFLERKAIESALQRLEKYYDLVLVEGHFIVVKGSHEYYNLMYEHPINRYLKGSGKKVTISVNINIASLSQQVSEYYAQSVGQTIKIKLYGKVFQALNRNKDIWNIKIIPIAVF